MGTPISSLAPGAGSPVVKPLATIVSYTCQYCLQMIVVVSANQRKVFMYKTEDDR